ncbi:MULTISPECIES: hypothetical protein [unclassified Microbacterium]|uniref:hypothetical protein n=1 Tax=unclassified Microbacterium TaxID=2609290 RepID=UPI00109C1D65|nr:MULTISPECIES: hypothetical protein [unclassified Microbacterium]
MRRLSAGVAVLALLLGSAAPAWAAPTTEVIQGRILRLVSVADWEAAGSLLPGQQVRWDVAVSAEAPDPGIVTIALSATGDAPLVLDVSICLREWQENGCPGGAMVERSAWPIPRDGAEVQLGEVADTDVAHVRLSIGLGEGAGTGSTNVRLHARGVGEDVTVGPGGGLAATGPSPLPPWALAGGAALVVVGVLLVARRRVVAIGVVSREPGGDR